MIRPKFCMIVGICGAGKTTFCNKMATEHGMIHISSDAIRRELRGDDHEYHPEDNDQVFKIMHRRVFDALDKGSNVLYDATNVTRKDRTDILNKIPNYVCKECYIVWAPISTCIQQDAGREYPVGTAVVHKMLKKFQAPFYDEGFEKIVVVRPDKFDQMRYTEQCLKDMDIPHDNPHHSLGVYEHCIAAFNYLHFNNFGDQDVRCAAYWHDVGKPYVKAFIDGHGNSCECAHFYQHQSYGAWMSYGLAGGDVRVAWLISTHMDPFWNSKYYLHLPSFLRRDIDLLHEADKNSH